MVVAGEFRNTTGVTQWAPQVTIFLKDENLETLATYRGGSAAPLVLPPNARGFFSVDTGDKPENVVSVVVTINFQTPQLKDTVQSEITRWAKADWFSSNMIKATGAFTNTLDRPIQDTRITLVLRDAFQRVLLVTEVTSAHHVPAQKEEIWIDYWSIANDDIADQAKSFQAFLTYTVPPR